MCLLGPDVVLSVELEERTLLLAALAMASVLHDNLVLRWLGTIVLLPVRHILLRLCHIELSSMTHRWRTFCVLLVILLMVRLASLVVHVIFGLILQELI